MKSIQVDYEAKFKTVTMKKNAETEDWVKVCHKFNDDVERVMDIENHQDYTGLYVCCDDYNNSFYYLVREDKALYRMKRKHFIDNIGLK
jgi:hypothetical protein